MDRFLSERILPFMCLRAYARLLEMDQKVLVAEYDRLVDTLVPVLTPTTRVHRQAAARDPYICCFN